MTQTCPECAAPVVEGIVRTERYGDRRGYVLMRQVRARICVADCSWWEEMEQPT